MNAPARRLAPLRPPSPRWRTCRHSALAFLLACASVSAASPAMLGTNLPPVAPDVPNVSSSVLRILGALVFVFALFFGGVWLFQNSARFGRNRGRPSHLQVLEIRALGNRHALFVVGYDQQRLLIASSPGGVTLLERLPEATAPEPQPVTAPPNFVETLRGLLKAR